MHRSTSNINILSQKPLISPGELKSSLPMDDELCDAVLNFREDLVRIIAHEDNRLLVIVGPCSIHDTTAAMEYAERLMELRRRYKKVLNIVMRVYFEKPRTTVGWKGFIIDPQLDGSYNIQDGLREARSLLVNITRMGMPSGTEVLGPIIPEYIADLISWAAIGARTIESQTHREIASGLSMSVGFKNGTDGDLKKAINAIYSAQREHSFIGIDQEGRTCVLHTRGNSSGHVIIRGGDSGPNYYKEDIERAENLFADIGVRASIIIDCSHDNSGKKHDKQAQVFRSALTLRKQGKLSIRGVMLESFLKAGKQIIQSNLSRLVYGQSITDACIDWEETRELLDMAAQEAGRWM